MNKKNLYLSVIVLILLTGSVQIFRKSWVWRTAGFMALSIVNQTAEIIKTHPGFTKLYLLNLPDNINGAYLLTSNLPQEIKYKLGKPIPYIVMTPLTNGFESDLTITGEKSARMFASGGFVLFLPKTDEHGRRYVAYPEFKAVETKHQTLEVQFLDPDFSWQKGNVLLFKNGIIQSVKKPY